MPISRTLNHCMMVQRYCSSTEVSLVKKDPGRAKQNSLATAGTNFTKPGGAQNKVDLCTGVNFMVRSRFREYEEETLRFPACSRPENAIFSPHIHGTQSEP